MEAVAWDKLCMDLILPIYDVFRPDVNQLDFLESKEIESHLNVLQHVKSHLAFLARLKKMRHIS